MILATDVDYRADGTALAAGVIFEDWSSAAPLGRVTAHMAEVAAYEPGAFYRRELPCLLALLDRLTERPRVIVVDGYVTLGAEGREGLGAHLYRALGGRMPVVGVAKTRFAETPAETEVLRGQSKHPLFVTAIGMASEEARAAVASMHGPYRVPSLLRMVDTLCRQGAV